MNDPTDVTAYGTRWLATAGTILKYQGGNYGLLYSGGGCIAVCAVTHTARSPPFPA